MVKKLRDVADYVIGSDNIITKKNPSMGVESFAYLSNARPSVYFYLGTGNPDQKSDMPAHGYYFDIDEDAISIGVALQCNFIYDYLTRE